jgi:hypothetical protein
MMKALLRRFVTALTSVLVISAAFAAGMGVYAAVLALWPLVLVWFFAQLNGAHRKDAELNGAHLNGARNLTQAQLDQAA